MPRLTTIPLSPIFDLEPWVGQQSTEFTFERINGQTGQRLGPITPIRTASLGHNTQSTIKRQLSINLGRDDMESINPLVERIEVAQVSDGVTYPLGRYLYTAETVTKFTSGNLGNLTLSDEMFIVDQPIQRGIDGLFKSTAEIYDEALADFPSVDLVAEFSPYQNAQAWGIGQSRGGILTSSATTGDYFSPWFGNDTKLHLIRTFDPAMKVPQFDYDAGNQVFRASITEQNNLLTAPNRFIVISNTNTGVGGADDPITTGGGSPTTPGVEAQIVAIADVPINAPNSFANRGFYIINQSTLQLGGQVQADAVARGLANAKTIFETVTFNTPPDPRHDSYDVCVWQGDLWLELAWTMSLTAGGAMSHTLRKAYRP